MGKRKLNGNRWGGGGGEDQRESQSGVLGRKESRVKGIPKQNGGKTAVVCSGIIKVIIVVWLKVT